MQVESPGRAGWQDARLAAELREAVVAQQFADVVDTTPPCGGPPARLHQHPNLDVAVVELDGSGRPRAAADVLFSPQYPDGVSIPLGADLGTEAVRWRQWDDDLWDHAGGQGSIDVIAGREGAAVDFMAPYPASVHKLMVAFGVLRLVDAGVVGLGDDYEYRPGAARTWLTGGPRTAPIGRLVDEMIAASANPPACALIKMLHDYDAVEPLNQHFDDLGLPTLGLHGTDPRTGGTWSNAITMGALDTAKLLLLISGGDALAPASREFLLSSLAEQGLNQALSTSNWCGRPYPAVGIPQATPPRWIDPVTGAVTVGGRIFSADSRPCDAAAEVLFAHKTGLADTTGADAGIVTALPGKPWRSYIVVVHSNLGYRYIDPDRPADAGPVQYTQKLARLGHAIDALVTSHQNP